MIADPNERPTVEELYDILSFWDSSINDSDFDSEKFGYKKEVIKAAFEEADKEIPNISTSYKDNSDAVYTSRPLTF
jgi:hypothetical protein